MSGPCPSCRGNPREEVDGEVYVCPDCAGTGKAENSITANEKPRRSRQVEGAVVSGEAVRLTLEEALAEAGRRGYSMSYSNRRYRMYDSAGRQIGTGVGWADLCSRMFALGYPVVERDPTAELVEAATALMAAIDTMPVAYTTGHRNAERFQYETWPKAVRGLRAALLEAGYES